jgi:CRISPR-associated protein Cmr6
MGHVLETGFVWHRILGVPYLPGSSVKGLTRAWAEQWGGAKHDEVIRLFGPRNEEAQKNPSVGNLIVFDAIPVNTPDLEVDIMNPHYAPYYEDKKGETPPADYHSPRPIFFLTVKEGVQFKFSIAPRPGGDTKDDDVELGFELLKCALENIGTGAKTAVGYGYFK